MNNVSLIGRLTKDPELSYTQGGTAYCRFTLAIDRPKKDGQDTGADFIRIVVWNNMAESCNKYLEKGRQVGISGRIQTGSYKNKEGYTVFTTDIVANNVKFLGGGQRNEDPEPEIPDDSPDTFETAIEDIPF